MHAAAVLSSIGTLASQHTWKMVESSVMSVGRLQLGGTRCSRRGICIGFMHYAWANCSGQTVHTNAVTHATPHSLCCTVHTNAVTHITQSLLYSAHECCDPHHTVFVVHGTEEMFNALALFVQLTLVSLQDEQMAVRMAMDECESKALCPLPAKLLLHMRSLAAVTLAHRGDSADGTVHKETVHLYDR